MNNPIDIRTTTPKLIPYKGENYSFKVLGIQPLHLIGGMSDAEFFYFLSAFYTVSALNEPLENLKELHQEAVSSNRHKPAEALGILIAIKETDDELFMMEMFEVYSFMNKRLANHVKTYHTDEKKEQAS